MIVKKKTIGFLVLLLFFMSFAPIISEKLHAINCEHIKIDEVMDLNFQPVNTYRHSFSFHNVVDYVLYKLDDVNTISIIDIHNPYNLKLLATYQINSTTGIICDILFDNKMMYIIYYDNYEGSFGHFVFLDEVTYVIEAVNIEDITNPTLQSSISLPEIFNNEYHSTTFSENLLYIAISEANYSASHYYHQRLFIIDYSIITVPNISISYNVTDAEYCTIRKTEDYLVVFSTYNIYGLNSTLRFYNTNETDIKLLMSYFFNNTKIPNFDILNNEIYYMDLKLYEKLLFHIKFDSSLDIIQKTYDVSSFEAHNFVVIDNYLGLISSNKFTILDRINLQNNSIINSYENSISEDSELTSYAIDNSRVYMGRRTNKRYRVLIILNFKNPRKITLLYPIEPGTLFVSFLVPIGILSIKIINFLQFKKKNKNLKL